MKGKFFLDTNIFIYAFDAATPHKQGIANDLIKSALLDGQGCTSYQVIQEFINVSTKKFSVPLKTADCRKYLEKVLAPICEVFVSIDLYIRALDIAGRWRYSFYDTLIITAALEADCNILYTEDLQHNQKIQSLTIYNPFLEK